jgi:hypothetical protein
VKGHTLEIEKELGTIAEAIKKEQAGKISFTKEEQKRILEASGTIRASVMQLLLEVIAAQQAQKPAGGREREWGEVPVKWEDKGGADGRGRREKGQPQAKATPKEVQAKETQGTQTRKETGSKGEERKTKEGQSKKANPQEGSWQTVSYAAKLKANIPLKETTVKMQGKSVEEVKAKLVRKLDIETTEPSDPREKRRSCPREQERGTTKKARNGVQNDRRNRDGVEEEAKPHSHADRTGDRMERGGDCRGGFLEERLDPEHRHNGRIQGGLKVPGQEAVSKVTEGEPDVRGGTTTPQSPHREAQDRGGADHGLRFNCNGLGHIAKSCKQKPKCHKCGKEGHKIKECRAEKSGTANRQGTEPTTRSDPR